MAKALGRWGVVSLVLLALSGSASGQDYPTKPIRLVVPYPAGGVVDFVARQIGQKMAGSMGQSIVVENRVGAGGTIATETTAKSAPDGYTVMVVFDTHAVNPHVYKNLRYDTFKDLATVSAGRPDSACRDELPGLRGKYRRRCRAHGKRKAGSAKLRLD